MIRTVGCGVGLVACLAVARPVLAVPLAQDTLRPPVLDTLIVSVDRGGTASARLPHAHVVVQGAAALVRGRTTDGLDDVLRSAPGVRVSNRYNYSLDQRIAIRGFGARSAFGVRGIKVLLDGIPLSTADGQTQLTNLEPGDLSRVEVWRGIGSSLYGNASGGVINLVSGPPVVDAPGAAVRATGLGDGFWKGAVEAGIPVGSGGADLSGSWTDVSGFREHSAARIGRARARLRTPLGARTDLTAVGWYATMPEALNPGALTDEEWRRDPTLAAPANVAAGADKAVWQAQGGLALRHGFGAGGLADLAVFGIRRSLDNTLTFGTIGLERWAYGLRGTVAVPLPGLAHVARVTAGLDAEWQRDDRENRTLDGTTITRDQSERVSGVGPFLQVIAEPGSGLALRAGARYDRSSFAVDDRLTTDGDDTGSRVMDAITWSVGALAHVAPWLAPFANAGTGFETPTTTELVNRPDGSGGLNPELEPQRMLQLEVGVRGRVGPVEYEVVGFHADVRDALVPFEDPAEAGRRFFRNAGRIRHRGVEVAGSLALAAWASVQAAYTFGDFTYREFVKPEGDVSGNRVPGAPRHQVFGTMTLWPGRAVWLTIEGEVVSAVPVDDANTAYAPSYAIGNVRAGWEGGTGRVSLSPFIALLNGLDERYVSSVVVNARGGRYFEPAPGRQLLAGLTVGF
jgi:iron complex outermembrane receptor protein